MRISHQHRFVFISNPKTGSESIRTLLDPHSEKGVVYPEGPLHPHTRAASVQHFFKDRGWCFENYLKFVVVRNPWARLVSCYEYIRLNWPQYGRPIPYQFHSWLQYIQVAGDLTDEFSCGKALCCSLQHIAGDGRGNLLVDRVLKLEDLKTTLPPLLAELGLESSEIPRINVTPHAPYTDYYTPAAVDFVARLYHDEIKQFGYAFGQ